MVAYLFSFNGQMTAWHRVKQYFGKYTSYKLRFTCKPLYFDDQMLLENISLCKQCIEKQAFVKFFCSKADVQPVAMLS
jgi:hypothetical protein